MKYFYAFLLFIVSSAGFLYFAGNHLSKPFKTSVGQAPASLEAVSVNIDGVHGWFAQGVTQNCALLMHGVRADRSVMTDRALMLKEHGYSVLLIDLQAHGSTAGEFISFGYLESESATKGVDYLKEHGCEKIASIGYSLGGAASLLGTKPIDVDVFVLEAVYSDIKVAVENRLSPFITHHLALLVSPFLYYQLPLRYGIPLEALSPIQVVPTLNKPVLIIAGTEDSKTTINESTSLFERINSPKAFWPVKGAGHEDFYDYDSKEYEARVMSFLEQHMQ